jgi:hypothetical protein
MPLYARPVPVPPPRKGVPPPGAIRPRPQYTGPQRGAAWHAIQLKAAQAAAVARGSPSRSGLPAQLKAGVEALSGLAMDDVRVHRNSPEPARLGALAYARGSDIHLGPGQERHLAHEAWHVVQQKQGRVRLTAQMKSVAVNQDASLEREADIMGTRAWAGGEGTGSLASTAAIAPVVQCHVKEAVTPLPIHASRPPTGKQLDLDLGERAPVTPEDEGKEGLTHDVIATMARKRIDRELENAEDTIALDKALQGIRAELHLTAIELADIGTPKAAVVFHVNPWFRHPIPLTNRVRWRMVGTSGITRVRWTSNKLQIGNASATVGRSMVADPLAPDHEPGSKSTADTEQAPLMAMLVNSGTTNVQNHLKFIKGHLLNDNVGGPGAAFNLFPITADANAKHLSFVEKYVKAQLDGRYVIAYEVSVADHGTRQVNTEHAVDADFNVSWSLLNARGRRLGNTFVSKIESRCGTVGPDPLNPQVYVPLFNRVNRDKRTPTALPQTGQWRRGDLTSPDMDRNSLVARSAPSSGIFMPGEISRLLGVTLAFAVILLAVWLGAGLL